MRVRSAAIAICLHALMLLIAGQAAACTTPVYRYAMINWIPAPYRFYHFHDGQISEEDAATNQMLDELAGAEPMVANIMFRPVDFNDEEQMKMIPRLVTKTWESHDKGPMYVVMTPWGAELHAGKLDKETVDAMVDSPMRKKICELLNEGKTGVMLTLESDDEDENKRTAKIIAESLAKVVEIGKSEDIPPEFPKDIDVGVLTLSRDDPAEKWLVKMLLSFESDLNEPEMSSKAMVFSVFGRGTAMLPYLGKGISEDNMVDCAINLCGPCSCTVRQNCPANDILMHWDWTEVVEKMAEEEAIAKYGPMEEQYAEAESADETDGQPADDAQAGESPEEGVESSNPQAEQTPTETAAEQDDLSRVELPEAIAKALAEGDMSASPEELEQTAILPFSGRSLWLISAGLAAAATFLFSVSYLVMQNRR